MIRCAACLTRPVSYSRGQPLEYCGACGAKVRRERGGDTGTFRDDDDAVARLLAAMWDLVVDDVAENDMVALDWLGSDDFEWWASILNTEPGRLRDRLFVLAGARRDAAARVACD